MIALDILKQCHTRLQSDYCSSVWDPHTQILINKIEAIQNRAARFVSGDYSRKSRVTSMKQRLNLETLQQRRKINRLTTFHEAVAGRLAVPVQTVLRPVRRSLRNTSVNSFIPINANKNCYKYSFIPRTIPEWNSLPLEVTTIQYKNKFKQAIQPQTHEQSNQ